MKLKQLFESLSAEKLVKFLADCEPYLDMCMKVNNVKPSFLFHGTKNAVMGLKEIPFRLRGQGRDMPKDIFDALNESMAEMFGGLEPRRWLFVTSEHLRTRRYGNTVVVFPTGTKFQWFKIDGVNDLYVDLRDDISQAWEDYYKEQKFEKEIYAREAYDKFSIAYTRDYLDYRFSSSDFVLNNKFDTLFANSDEIMVFGDTFYSILPDELENLIKTASGLTPKQQKYVDWLSAELKRL